MEFFRGAVWRARAAHQQQQKKRRQNPYRARYRRRRLEQSGANDHQQGTGEDRFAQPQQVRQTGENPHAPIQAKDAEDKTMQWQYPEQMPLRALPEFRRNLAVKTGYVGKQPDGGNCAQIKNADNESKPGGPITEYKVHDACIRAFFSDFPYVASRSPYCSYCLRARSSGQLTEKCSRACSAESKYDPLRLNANAQSRQSESCAEQHHNVPDAYCDRMTLAHPDHSLVIVFAVRLPELLAAQHTPAQGNRCVQNKGREHRQRKSAPPNAAHRSDISQCAGQKTERSRARIAQKDPRGRPVKA